jgi:hypothetical protein
MLAVEATPLGMTIGKSASPVVLVEDGITPRRFRTLSRTSPDAFTRWRA